MRAGRGLTRLAIALLALCALAAAIDGWFFARAARWNALIASGAPIAEAPGLPPEVRFAQAQAQAASGANDVATERLRPLQGDSALGQAARYNSANALMRQALEVRAGPQPGQAIALIELAKETYREILRQDPAQWNARYNLERAQRLLADPDEGADEAANAPPAAERAATTMRGYSPGLP